MLRIVGVNIPDEMDVFTGLRMIKGLDTPRSRTKIERILTKAKLYTWKHEKTGQFSKQYPKIGDLTWKQKSRLLDLVDIPRAVIRNVRISPRKLRLVADAIRGKHVDEALAILSFMPKAGAPILYKLLKSAISNASNNHDLKADKLYVSKIQVNGGTVLRRFMARARGRACRIRKPTSHAFIVLREKFNMPKAVSEEPTTSIPPKTSAKTVSKKQTQVIRSGEPKQTEKGER